jgi:ABC-type Zn uptake system ZnuABC Zn-binding protein ZnuA
MRQTLITVIISVSILSIPLLARGVQAQEYLTVKVAGATPAVASHSHSHDITEDALKDGAKEYVIGSDSADSHRITLNSEQLLDIQEGTTVIVRSSKDEDSGKVKAHQHRVSITLDAEAESGW